MERFSVVFVSFLLVSLAGCSPAVYTDVAADAQFGTYETYAILPAGQNLGENTIYSDKIMNEVDQEMRDRGYVLDPDDPDLLVNVKTMYDEEEKLVATGYYPATYDYYGPDFYTPTTMAPYYYTGYTGIPSITGTGIREVEYIEGTFVVDVIEASGANKVIWRGWSETPIDPEDIDESVRDYVDNIFDEYPVEDD